MCGTVPPHTPLNTSEGCLPDQDQPVRAATKQRPRRSTSSIPLEASCSQAAASRWQAAACRWQAAQCWLKIPPPMLTGPPAPDDGSLSLSHTNTIFHLRSSRYPFGKHKSWTIPSSIVACCFECQHNCYPRFNGTFNQTKMMTPHLVWDCCQLTLSNKQKSTIKVVVPKCTRNNYSCPPYHD